jgi:hypothetical protein
MHLLFQVVHLQCTTHISLRNRGETSSTPMLPSPLFPSKLRPACGAQSNSHQSHRKRNRSEGYERHRSEGRLASVVSSVFVETYQSDRLPRESVCWHLIVGNCSSTLFPDSTAKILVKMMELITLEVSSLKQTPVQLLASLVLPFPFYKAVRSMVCHPSRSQVLQCLLWQLLENI